MVKITVKKLISHRNKYPIVAAFAGIFMALYFIGGAFYLGDPRYLPIDPVEMNIPFIHESIWIYIMLYPFAFWSVFTYRDESNLNHVLYSFMFVAIVSVTVFILVPTAYPREFFPLPYDNNLTINLFRNIRHLDKPVNCLPSLHVSMATLFAFGHLPESKKRFVISFVIGTLISISTLTTKQHYIADVVTGFTLGFCTYFGMRSMVAFTKE